MQSVGGPRALAEVAHRLGIESRLPDHPSLALGTAEVGVLELASAYAAVANGGLAVTPTGVTGGTTAGQPFTAPRAPAARVVEAAAAAALAEMMSGVVAHGTGRAAAVPGRAVAGKTGTTQDFRDAWFVGWISTASGPVVIAVWLGNDDATSMAGVTGSTLPARLFREIAQAVR